MIVCREVSVVKEVEGAVVIDEQGRAVEETTGVAVGDEEWRDVTVPTAVHGVVLGSVLDRQQQQQVPVKEPTTDVTITKPSRDDDGCCVDCGCCDCCDDYCRCCSWRCVLWWMLYT